MERVLTVAGWTLTLQWDRDNPTGGPQSLKISAGDDLSERDKALGIRSGVLRQVETEVMTMVARLEQDNQAKYRDVLRRRVSSLPGGGAREGGRDYYRALLQLHDEIGAFSSNPAGEIALAMDTSVKTVRSQLARARVLALEELLAARSDQLRTPPRSPSIPH